MGIIGRRCRLDILLFGPSSIELREGKVFVSSGLSLLKSMINFVVEIQRENQGALGIFC